MPHTPVASRLKTLVVELALGPYHLDQLQGVFHFLVHYLIFPFHPDVHVLVYEPEFLPLDPYVFRIFYLGQVFYPWVLGSLAVVPLHRSQPGPRFLGLSVAVA